MVVKLNYRAVWIIFLIIVYGIALYSQVEEMKLKIVFIDRFTQFIDWGNEKQSDSKQTKFVIGTLDKGDIYAELKKFFTDRQIKGKVVEVITPVSEEEYLNCDLLYLSNIDSTRLTKILSIIKDKPVLTICDEQEFSEYGVMITIYRKSDHLLFCIDESALTGAGLKANYLLLEYAEIINPVNKVTP